MNLVAIANKTIPAAQNTTVLKKQGNTRDIIKEVLDCYADSKHQLKDFAPYLKGKTVLETCSNIFNFWKSNITYKVDDEGVQWIKTPAAVWATKICDCKSFSVAVASCLDALGIKGKFRFTSYGLNNEIPTHVYVVALHAGKEIIIDCVWDWFNSQKRFTKKWDYNMTDIYRVSGLGSTGYAKGELNINVNDPNLTEAQLELALHKQTLEMEQMIRRKKGIGAIGDAMDNGYQVEIEAVNAAMGSLEYMQDSIAGKAKRQERKLKKALKKNDGKGVNKRQAKLLEKAGIAIKKRKEGLLKKVGKGLKKIVKAIPRLLVKTQLPKSAPFFLYTFITDEKVLAKLPEAVATKKAKAEHYKSIIVDKFEMKPEVFDKTIRNGIMNQLGDTPENVIARWMKESNFSVGVLPIIAAGAKILWTIIKKVAGKAVENLKNDVTTYAPAVEDWGGVSQETKNEMATQTENSNSTGVQTFGDGGNDPGTGDEERYSNPADNPQGEGPLNEEKELPEVVLKSTRQKESGGTGMLLIAVAAIALIAGSGKGKSK